jgi:transglutaminase-like putative cysteine protease
VLIRIRHITRYAYAEPVGYAVQCLRLTPASFRGQRVVDWRVHVEGAGEATQFKDGHGNLVHLATIAVEHRALTIEAEGTVETRDTSGVVDGLASSAPPRIYLRVTELTRPLDTIRELAHSAPATDSVGRLHALSAAIGDRVALVLGTSDAGTSAAQALAAGKGVCQDHAHIFIAAARALAIPARYVTGYLLLEPEAVAAAHHAWAEAWVEGLGWVGFDVTNRVCPTERYVRLATGLDATGAAPVIGARRGGAAERPEVSVLVQQQQNAQQ